MSHREFTIPNEYDYDRSDPVRWVLSHIFRYKYRTIGCLILLLLGNILMSTARSCWQSEYRNITSVNFCVAERSCKYWGCASGIDPQPTHHS